MSKGRKFDAHKKHFDEKMIKYKRFFDDEVQFYKDEAEKSRIILNDVKKQNEKLVIENEKLKQKNNILNCKYEKTIEHSKLSDEEILTACRHNNSLGNIEKIINQLVRQGGIL